MNETNVDWILRIGFGVTVLLLLMRWEFKAPRRPLTSDRTQRWGSNLLLVCLNSLLLRAVLPISAMAMAVLAQAHGWGLLRKVSLPGWLELILALLALDLVLYLQHVLFHVSPFLWRLHMVHHADRDMDATTGLRFHTVEIIVSLAIKGAAIILLGPSVLAVVLFEVVLLVTSLFSHANIQLSPRIDRWLRFILVTPDMHRVHHSVDRRETNSNFGFNVPWWDYLLGTYRAQPAKGHEGMTIGLEQFRDDHAEQLPWMLAMPVIGDPGNYPLNRRGEESSPPAGVQRAAKEHAEGNGHSGNGSEVADAKPAESKGAAEPVRSEAPAGDDNSREEPAPALAGSSTT
jgi:sterol desaturase/sphingolipid hydroxylase (fatty acid hydroxylase superfamily)